VHGYLFLRLLARFSVMAKTLTAYLARKKLERELFGARQRLIDLVELYDSGLWRRLYKEEAFMKAVRRARSAVDHLTDVLHRYDRG
jgi:hypothetical protein